MPVHNATPKNLIRESIPEDVDYIAAHMRAADVAEVTAHSGSTPYDALAKGLAWSSRCLTAVWREDPICMFGVGTIMSDVGMAWMLGTKGVEDGSLWFLRNSKDCLQALHEDHTLLFNYVDARNEVHIKWLRWLGFSFVNLHQEFGVGRLPFYEIVRIN